jgi:tetratricopeptide (TPR) repeat protein
MPNNDDGKGDGTNPSSLESDCNIADEASFAEILGPNCQIMMVDKNRKVLGEAKPEEMQRELMTRAGTQKRLGAVTEHLKPMNRSDKMTWALDLKAQANRFYASANFGEAARLYNDCLCALDLDGSEADVIEVQQKLQLPVCTNLAACMIEMGSYRRCIEICDIAIDIDSHSCKAYYRRGLCHYRLGDHHLARPDFDLALQLIQKARQNPLEDEADARSLNDLERRVIVYMSSIRKHRQHEKVRCRQMLERSLYPDRPVIDESQQEPDFPVDDSDEAIDAVLAKHRSSWCVCCCRQRITKAKQA